MVNIAAIAEQNITHTTSADRVISPSSVEGRELVSDAISKATAEIAESLNCKAIVTSTLSGYTTRHVAKERPHTPIICVTPNETTYRRMALVWGVSPLLVPEFSTIDDMLGIVVRAAHNNQLVQAGDMLVIIAGVPFGISGQTNFLKVHIVGESGELEVR
jgi:pyruvate kinase